MPPLITWIVLLAFSVEAVVGFGSTVLSVTLGAQVMPIETILPALVPVNLLLSIGIVLRDVRSVDVRLLLRRVLPMVAIGTLVGMALFRLQTGRGLRLGFAAFVIALATMELVLAVRSSEEKRPKMGVVPATILLLLGGVAHGLYGSGGPLVVYVAGREIEGKARFRATLSALWIVLNVALLANYSIAGMIGRPSGRLSLIFVCALPFAFVGGEWVHKRVNDRLFRFAVWSLLLVGGIALLARSLAG